MQQRDGYPKHTPAKPLRQWSNAHGEHRNQCEGEEEIPVHAVLRHMLRIIRSLDHNQPYKAEDEDGDGFSERDEDGSERGWGEGNDVRVESGRGRRRRWRWRRKRFCGDETEGKDE